MSLWNDIRKGWEDFNLRIDGKISAKGYLFG